MVVDVVVVIVLVVVVADVVVVLVAVLVVVTVVAVTVVLLDVIGANSHLFRTGSAALHKPALILYEASFSRNVKKTRPLSIRHLNVANASRS